MEKFELSGEELNEVTGGMTKTGPTRPTIPPTTGPTFPTGTGPYFPTDPIVVIHI
jgi:hypothetical protein